MTPRRHFMALAATLFAATSLSPASAQDWPTKTVTLVVGFAAGGATDGAARIIARKLQENIGRPVVVENRAGAGGNLAHQYVAKAAPDGSVILLGSIGPLAIAPHLMNVGYDPQKDLAPLTMDVKSELDKPGLTPAPRSGEELARLIASESKAWGRLVKGRRIKAD